MYLALLKPHVFGLFRFMALGVGWLFFTSNAFAHGISESSRQTMEDGSMLDYIWLGAEHMVTGYDHLLFLFGVIFFLSSFRDVVRFITAFTVGHCITLLGATMMGVTANAYIIDAVIALSVIYKGFENLDGFKKVLGVKAPNLLWMVFAFGLIHGFGLSTRLQEITLGQEGLVSRILAFNVGVELGQVVALTAMLAVFKVWRTTKSFEWFGTAANVGLIGAGIGLFVLQVDGFLHEDDHHVEEGTEHRHDGDHGHEEEGAHQEHGAEKKQNASVEGEPTSSPTVDTPVDSDGTETQGGHSHGQPHTHGSGKPHTHGPVDSNEDGHKGEAPKPSKKHHHGKSHTHGSGKPHSH